MQMLSNHLSSVEDVLEADVADSQPIALAIANAADAFSSISVVSMLVLGFTLSTLHAEVGAGGSTVAWQSGIIVMSLSSVLSAIGTAFMTMQYYFIKRLSDQNTWIDVEHVQSFVASTAHGRTCARGLTWTSLSLYLVSFALVSLEHLPEPINAIVASIIVAGALAVIVTWLWLSHLAKPSNLDNAIRMTLSKPDSFVADPVGRFDLTRSADGREVTTISPSGGRSPPPVVLAPARTSHTLPFFRLLAGQRSSNHRSSCHRSTYGTGRSSHESHKPRLPPRPTLESRGSATHPPQPQATTGMPINSNGNPRICNGTRSSTDSSGGGRRPEHSSEAERSSAQHLLVELRRQRKLSIINRHSSKNQRI